MAESMSVLADVATRLKAEPLTHLMLGNLELFHSNLLAWFFDCLPETADDVLKPLTAAATSNDAIRRVVREQAHLDMVFYWPGHKPLVLENKVFALPEELQLERYSRSAFFDANDVSGWLLSLSDPGWPDDQKILGGYQWRWLSYRQLAARIRKAVPPTDLSYSAETMRHYANVVGLLCDLVDAITISKPGEVILLPSDVGKDLGDTRLAGRMAKLRAASARRHVIDALREASIPDYTVEADYSHGEPTISCYMAADRLARGARIGWQLQGADFRLLLCLPHIEGKGAKQDQERIEFARANEAIFDFTELDAILGTQKQQLRPPSRAGNLAGFNQFSGDFVYRYKKTDGLTVSQLRSAAVAIACRVRA